MMRTPVDETTSRETSPLVDPYEGNRSTTRDLAAFSVDQNMRGKGNSAPTVRIMMPNWNRALAVRITMSIFMAIAAALICVLLIIPEISSMRSQTASHPDAEVPHMRSQTSSQPNSKDVISLAANTCEYDLSDLNDFDQGADHMISSGWRFFGDGPSGHWSQSARYRPVLTNLLPKAIRPSPTAYWGYGDPGDGCLKLHLKHFGRLNITVGNAFQEGITAVSLELATGGAKMILEVPETTLMQVGTSDFAPNDTLVIEGQGQAIIVIDYISLECFPTPSPTAAPTAPTRMPTKIPTRTPTLAPTLAPTPAPTPTPTRTPTRAPTLAPTPTPTRAPTRSPTLAPTWKALSPLTEGSVCKIAGESWLISTNFTECVGKCLYEGERTRQVHWWHMHEALKDREECANTCVEMPYRDAGTTCLGFIYPTSEAAPRHCYSVLDNNSWFCSKSGLAEKTISFCDENLRDFTYHMLVPQSPSQQLSL